MVTTSGTTLKDDILRLSETVPWPYPRFGRGVADLSEWPRLRHGRS